MSCVIALVGKKTEESEEEAKVLLTVILGDIIVELFTLVVTGGIFLGSFEDFAEGGS